MNILDTLIAYPVMFGRCIWAGLIVACDDPPRDHIRLTRAKIDWRSVVWCAVFAAGMASVFVGMKP